MRACRIVLLLFSITLLHAPPAAADEFVPFSPGDVLVGTFDVDGVFPYPFGTPDVVSISVLLNRIEPFGSHTTELFDGGTLLGTYTSTEDGALGSGLDWVTSYYVSPTSIFSFGNPTVIDMAPFAAGSIRGLVNFMIETGAVQLRAGPGGGFEIFIGQAVAPDQAIGISIIPDSPLGPVVPEPTSLLLIGGGLGLLGLRRWRRRLNRV